MVPGESGDVFWVESANVGIERRLVVRQTIIDRRLAVIPKA